MTIGARTLKRSHLVLLAAMGLHCSSSQTAVTADQRVGSAQIALTSTPSNALCMNLIITGTRTVSANFDLTPGSDSVVSVDGLPVGFDTFSGLVYPVACDAVTDSTTASWQVVPTVANIQPDVVDAVSLKLQTNATATVCLNFEGQDAASDACRR